MRRVWWRILAPRRGGHNGSKPRNYSANGYGADKDAGGSGYWKMAHTGA